MFAAGETWVIIRFTINRFNVLDERLIEIRFIRCNDLAILFEHFFQDRLIINFTFILRLSLLFCFLLDHLFILLAFDFNLLKLLQTFIFNIFFGSLHLIFLVIIFFCLLHHFLFINLIFDNAFFGSFLFLHHFWGFILFHANWNKILFNIKWSINLTFVSFVHDWLLIYANIIKSCFFFLLLLLLI